MDRRVQTVFVLLLIGVLLASVFSFVVMGLRRRRRINALARKAHEMRMRFSPADPFDLAHRYGALDLISSGHSARADNVTHGRLEGWPVRAFDFSYELGHGTRRLTRHYGVVVAETDLHLPPILLWHEKDLQAAPMAARRCDQRLACWACAGQESVASVLADACWPLADRLASMQCHNSTVMVCIPARKGAPDYAAVLECMPGILHKLRQATRGDDADKEISPKDRCKSRHGAVKTNCRGSRPTPGGHAIRNEP